MEQRFLLILTLFLLSSFDTDKVQLLLMKDRMEVFAILGRNQELPMFESAPFITEDIIVNGKKTFYVYSFDINSSEDSEEWICNEMTYAVTVSQEYMLDAKLKEWGFIKTPTNTYVKDYNEEYSFLATRGTMFDKEEPFVYYDIIVIKR